MARQHLLGEAGGHGQAEPLRQGRPRQVSIDQDQAAFVEPGSHDGQVQEGGRRPHIRLGAA